MRLNDIEMSIPVGRTSQGVTITVRDLLLVLSTVSGTRLGSQQFDQMLADPQQLHAPGLLDDAQRYGLLSSILDGTVQPPERISIQSSLPDGDTTSGRVFINVASKNDLAEHLNELLDEVLTSQQNRGQK